MIGTSVLKELIFFKGVFRNLSNIYDETIVAKKSIIDV